MLEGILKLFAPRIEIYIEPSEFQFTHGARRERIATYLFLSSDKVLGIGEPFEGAKQCTRIDLFSPSSPATKNKLDALEAFLRYGIRKVLNRKWTIRPLLYIRNTESLNQLFCGYQNAIMRLAAQNSGAYECEIEGEQGVAPLRATSGARVNADVRDENEWCWVADTGWRNGKAKCGKNNG